MTAWHHANWPLVGVLMLAASFVVALLVGPWLRRRSVLYPLAHFAPTPTEPAFGWAIATPCACGTVLPPMSDWHHAGRDWSHTTCGFCGRHYVDEEDHIAIYRRLDDDEGCGCVPFC